MPPLIRPLVRFSYSPVDLLAFTYCRLTLSTFLLAVVLFALWGLRDSVTVVMQSLIQTSLVNCESITFGSPGNYWRLLWITGDYCGLLGITGDYWRLLRITGDYYGVQYEIRVSNLGVVRLTGTTSPAQSCCTLSTAAQY